MHIAASAVPAGVIQKQPLLAFFRPSLQTSPFGWRFQALQAPNHLRHCLLQGLRHRATARLRQQKKISETGFPPRDPGLYFFLEKILAFKGRAGHPCPGHFRFPLFCAAFYSNCRWHGSSGAIHHLPCRLHILTPGACQDSARQSSCAPVC